MQRRNVAHSSSPSQGVSPSRIGRAGPSTPTRSKGRSEPLSASVLLVIAVVLTIATYMFPSEVSEVEQEVARDLYTAEQKIEELWRLETGGGVMTEADKRAAQQAASQRMLEQSSRWVDGEKKLKEKLTVLAKRQAEGKDLGVPVLTRWLGEDIPAWVGEGVDEKEWRKKVDAKYEEMRKEELEWRKKMQALLDEEEKAKSR